MFDIKGIETILGVPGTTHPHNREIVVFRKSNPLLDINLKLEVNATTGWLRLHMDRIRRRPPYHLASVEMTQVDDVMLDMAPGRIVVENPGISFVITSDGSLDLSIG